MILRDQATSSGDGENISLHSAICPGWISVLPSMPSVRPCSHSARKPCLVAEVVVDAVDHVEAIGARRQQRHRQPGQDGEAPAGCQRARFLQQVIGAEHEAGEPRHLVHGGDLAHVEDGHRRFHHRPHAGGLRAAHAGMDLRHVHDVAGPRHLRHQDGIGVRLRRHLQVLHAPGRVEAVDADHQFAPAIAPGLHGGRHLGAGLRLGIGRHRILEVEDQRIGVERLGLLERALIGAGHVENAASGSQGHGTSVDCCSATLDAALREWKPTFG